HSPATARPQWPLRPAVSPSSLSSRRSNFRIAFDWLNRTADAELAHARLQRGALHAQQRRGAFGAGDAPLGWLRRAQDVLSFRFFESGDARSQRSGSREGVLLCCYWYIGFQFGEQEEKPFGRRGRPP